MFALNSSKDSMLDTINNILQNYRFKINKKQTAKPLREMARKHKKLLAFITFHKDARLKAFQIETTTHNNKTHI